MGYISFVGSFALNRPLDAQTTQLLKGLNETRRCTRRDVSKALYGVDGELYCGTLPPAYTLGVDYHRPPGGQPGLHCRWRPNDAGTAIEWDGVETFTHYIEWIEYLIARVLRPQKYILNGTVQWSGAGREDLGKIIIVNNIVRVKVAKIIYVSRNKKGQVGSEKSQPAHVVE